MQARINHPAITIPGAFDALKAFGACAEKGGVPEGTIQLVQLRASQINGCSACVDMHSRMMLKAGESE